MTEAGRLYELTNGAWDGTVRPLVDLWGFYAKKEKRSVPDKDKILSFLPEIGFNHIELLPTGHLVKRKASITLDLASIAKGYGVDAVSEVLRKKGIDNFLVEIGGEVYASGQKKENIPWRVGINRPEKGASLAAVYRSLSLRNRALATSGDYRNFFEIDGKRYSHVLDPKTGYPVNNAIVSVSILAQTCMLADGLATAVMIMGTRKGINLINTLETVEGMIVSLKEDGTLIDHSSKGFPPATR